jgi:hypothetical protein
MVKDYSLRFWLWKPAANRAAEERMQAIYVEL